MVCSNSLLFCFLFEEGFELGRDDVAVHKWTGGHPLAHGPGKTPVAASPYSFWSIFHLTTFRKQLVSNSYH